MNNSPALEVTKTETIPVSFSYQLDGRMHSVASQLPSAEDLAF